MHLLWVDYKDGGSQDSVILFRSILGVTWKWQYALEFPPIAGFVSVSGKVHK